jgi:intracellular septation protein A
MKALLHSARYLAEDMASTLFFLVLMLVTKNVPLSVGLGMALGVGQIAWQLWRRNPIDLMQGMSLFLVVAAGAATLLTHDPRFVMVKPSVIYVIVGIVMLKPGWMNRYLPAQAIEIVPDLGFVFGYVWAGLMFASAVLNVYLALRMAPVAWAATMSIYAIVSKLTLFLIQYAVMRFIGRRRWLRDHPPIAVPA